MSKLVKQRGSTPGSSLFRPEDETKLLTEAIGSSLEAVETISSCTSHMRRIIDDILTLSKLDANLLKIAPSPVDTGAFINTIQKMLEIDAERVGVVLQAQADVSVSKLNAEWVEIDPGRVTQVRLARLVLAGQKRQTSFATAPPWWGPRLDLLSSHCTR